ncbi:MAG: hypothetical protein LBH00_08885 [Planctomycetaceae bacterium]|jgi:hypothetical protein|nr:hypothetical protein [Planctomycetaceae bacterium]
MKNCFCLKDCCFTLIALALLFAGCTQNVHTPDDGHNHGTPAVTGQHTPDDGHNHGTPHEIDGWCLSHEVPEEKCALCNPKVAAECKKSGDWCQEHNTAESQCFVCDPSRKEKWVTLYETRHGKKPPKAGQ